MLGKKPYWEAQATAAERFRDRRAWARMALHNIAGSARFSSATTIRGYARDILKLRPVAVEMGRQPEPDAAASSRLRSV